MPALRGLIAGRFSAPMGRGGGRAINQDLGDGDPGCSERFKFVCC
jgi:hypothetical protein